jgi:hypothetical protein
MWNWELGTGYWMLDAGEIVDDFIPIEDGPTGVWVFRRKTFLSGILADRFSSLVVRYWLNPG